MVLSVCHQYKMTSPLSFHCCFPAGLHVILSYVFNFSLNSLFSLLSLPDHRRHSLILKWVPDPPSGAQVDSAFKKVTHNRPKDESSDVIGLTRFKEWAVVLYVDAVVGNAGKAVLSQVPIGIAGIAGIGALTRSRRELIGTAAGAYAVGIATWIYLSLSG